MPRKKRRFVRDAKILKDKALYSLSRGLVAFNSHEDSGRVTAVLLHFQHAGEMLVKAALVQKGCAVFDKKSHKAEGMKRWLNRAKEHLQSSEGEIGVLRTIDALRDTEQHWYAAVPEEILYLESRAFITAFDDILGRVFGERLADFFPSRILPISTLPVPRDTIHLFDSNYRQIQALLVPGKRQRDNALGLIRTLLAMESHVVEEVEVNEADVRRVERVARSGNDWTVAFPRLSQIRTAFQGEGQEILVRFSKTEGAPVRFVTADDPTEAAAVREIDLQRRFRYSATELAKQIGLTTNKSAVLKRYCKTDSDPQCMHEFVFGSQKHKRYSDTAIEKLRTVLKTADLDQIHQKELETRRERRHP
jgi:hypothetical protein